MYSFYGGKQGRTYNLVERYDQIYIDQTQLPQFSSGTSYEVGSRFTFESRIYLVLPQDDQGSAVTITTDDLTDDSKVIQIKGMVNEFQKGGAYTDANYGQYVIIDTILNQNHKNDDINGIIYRRGFDYTEPVISYHRPQKTDQEQRTITDTINGQEYTYTGRLNIYHDYKLRLENNQPVPDDQGFNDDRWVASWRKYVLKPGGGAIYVGQIVGPQGDTPEIRGVSWEDFVDINEQAGDQVTHGIVTMTDTPGWSEQNGYVDSIKTGYCNIKDKDGQVIGAYISFDIPKTVFKVSAQSVDPYGDTPRDHYDIASGQTDQDISIVQGIEHQTDSKIWKYEGLIHQHTESGVEAGHPFYYNFDIAVPSGIHGQDVEQITKETVSQINAKLPAQDRIVIDQNDVHSDDYIAEDDEYISYYTRHYNNSAEGNVSAPLGRWPYRVIKTITTNLKQRAYFNNWEGPAVVGNLYILDESNDIMAICIGIDVNTIGTTGSETDFIADYQASPKLGTEIRSGETLWRVVKIPSAAAAASLQVDYTAGKNETLGNGEEGEFRLLDYLTVDDLGNLYAVYSDSDTPYYLSTLGSIRDIQLTNEGFVITYQDGYTEPFKIKQIDTISLENSQFRITYTNSDENPYTAQVKQIDNIIFENEDDITKQQKFKVNYKGIESQDLTNSLNRILAIQRVGDNIAVLYSDPNYRASIENDPSTHEGIDYYKLGWTDPVTGKVYPENKPLVWVNLNSSLVSQYHIQGEYTLSDLKGDTTAADFTIDLSKGFTGELVERAGWLVTVEDTQGNRFIYAFDYNDDINNPSHRLYDGTLSCWYEVMSLAASAIDPNLTVVMSENQPATLKNNGLWLVVSYGHDN